MTLLVPALPAGTATADAASGPARTRRFVQRALLGSVVVLLTQQVLALGERDPLVDPMSSYVHVSTGWLFPLGMLLMAAATGVTAWALTTRRSDRVAGYLLWTAAFGALVAAIFPADDGTLPTARISALGEVHRYGSIALLVLPLVAAVRLATRIREADLRVDARLRRFLYGSITCGLLFLIGFLPHLLGVSRIPGVSLLTDISGASQRVMVLLLVAVVAVLAGWALHDDSPRGDQLAVGKAVQPQQLARGDRGDLDGQNAGDVRDVLGGQWSTVDGQVDSVLPGSGDRDRRGVAGPGQLHLQPANGHPGQQRTGGGQQVDVAFQQVGPGQPVHDIGLDPQILHRGAGLLADPQRAANRHP